MPSDLTVLALVVAAGRGVRVGGDVPKQYQVLRGRPVLQHTLEALLAIEVIGGVRVVIGADDRALYDQATAPLASNPKLLEPVIGGAERQISVRLGLQSLTDQGPDVVLIHDGVRPFVTGSMVAALLDALADPDVDGAIAALPVVDTLKRQSETGVITETVDRAGLWRAQTPQAFHYRALSAAHARAENDLYTDDAALAEAAGLAVKLVEGGPHNIKLTTPEDFALAERFLASPASSTDMQTRVGFGFDVHRFGPGDQVILCGVPIPHNKALAGHSDADVALHAVTDALLGTIGAGDIGSHFPPTDEKWRGAPSDIFVAHAGSLIAQQGGQILHVDLTIICERPKIGPHREAMRQRLAEVLQTPVSAISIKATTTEGLGFTGRGEGIAAQAVASVLLLSNLSSFNEISPSSPGGGLE